METWMEQILQRARLAAAAASEKQATNIMLLDMRDLSTITDIFMICGAANERQVKAIADEIEAQLSPITPRRLHRDGGVGASWVVLDLGGVLAHIFLEEERARLELEKLWGDAPRLDSGVVEAKAGAEE